MRIIICDSSSLIRLRKGGVLHLLEKLFDKAYIPEAVKRECRENETAEILSRPFFELKKVNDILFDSLGEGEREAISLAVELGIKNILIDDEDGTKKACKYGLRIFDAIFIIRVLKERKIVLSIKEILDRMIMNGERVEKVEYFNILKEAGEL